MSGRRTLSSSDVSLLVELAEKLSRFQDRPLTLEEIGVDLETTRQFEELGLVIEIKQPEFHGETPYPPSFIRKPE